MKKSLAGHVLAALLPLAFAAPTAADEPAAVPFQIVFDDVNPCSGDVHNVTISGTSFVHSHDGRTVVHSERTITTSPTGFVGHGADSSVANGQVMMFRLADILTNASGERIRARFVLLIDLSTGAVRVQKGGVTCLGR